jgi:hypothetical protein
VYYFARMTWCRIQTYDTRLRGILRTSQNRGDQYHHKKASEKVHIVIELMNPTDSILLAPPPNTHPPQELSLQEKEALCLSARAILDVRDGCLYCRLPDPEALGCTLPAALLAPQTLKWTRGVLVSRTMPHM